MSSEFYINRLVSNIQAVDSNSLLSPELLQQIVAVVLAEVENKQSQDGHRDDDRRLDQGAARRL